MWKNGSIPIELGWTVLAQIPNCNAYTWGIGLLEVMWKVVEEGIYTRIKTVVKFHDVLHGFCACRGRGAATMELKLAQELVSVDQYPLFLVFLYLSKAHENLDRGRIL